MARLAVRKTSATIRALGKNGPALCTSLRSQPRILPSQSTQSMKEFHHPLRHHSNSKARDVHVQSPDQSWGFGFAFGTPVAPPVCAWRSPDRTFTALARSYSCVLTDFQILPFKAKKCFCCIFTWLMVLCSNRHIFHPRCLPQSSVNVCKSVTVIILLKHHCIVTSHLKHANLSPVSHRLA